jgi:ABC-type transporter Mla maintaining outer membrane lipid asymmetry permease subunit MlaE
MNPMLSRLLGVIAALAAACFVLWFVLGFTTWVNGSPLICDVQWLLLGVVPLAVVGFIIYWTNWHRPR